MIAARFNTKAVHGGAKTDHATGAVSPSIVTSVTFEAPFGDIGFSAAGTVEDAAPYVYAREGHPNSRELEQRLALLDGGEAALVFGSGIGAISGLLLHKLDPGDHLVMSDITYAGTAEFARSFLSRKGVEISYVYVSDSTEIAAAVQKNTKIIFVETPCNPVLTLVDIERVAEIAHSTGAELVVDSTFATAVLQRPLSMGADLVVHSLTKYYGGHGDALGGVVIGNTESIKALEYDVGIHLGAAISAFNAWLIMRGIETLPIRMKAYTESAHAVASFLESHDFVRSVRYLGLPSHPQYELAKRQMTMAGGMISFTVEDSQKLGSVLDDNLRYFSYAPSLGLSRSLILFCDTADLQDSTFKLAEGRYQTYSSWAGDGFFRLSIGLEDSEDLCAELGRAFDAAARSIQ